MQLFLGDEAANATGCCAAPAIHGRSAWSWCVVRDTPTIHLRATAEVATAARGGSGRRPSSRPDRSATYAGSAGRSAADPAAARPPHIVAPGLQGAVVVGTEVVQVFAHEAALQRRGQLRGRRQHRIGEDVARDPRIGAVPRHFAADGVQQEQPVRAQAMPHPLDVAAIVLVADVLELPIEKIASKRSSRSRYSCRRISIGRQRHSCRA